MGMLAVSLQSGSNGNCIYVEAGGAKLLFDAGIPGIRAQERLKAIGRDIRDVDALIISHEHSDHVLYAGVYQRKYGLPVYISSATLEAALKRFPLGRLSDVNIFLVGGVLRFEGAAVRTVPTSHDAADGAAFVISSGQKGKRLGILTDLGHTFEGLPELAATLDAVILESNFDPEMLRRGSYPAPLKRRIQGPRGHLSNIEAAELLSCCRGLEWACLAHLSENNNRPELALKTHRAVNPSLPLHVAGRHAPSRVLKV